MNKAKDETYMAMAFALAEKARGRTSPNPMVGALIVKDDRIVGWGGHEEAGKPHAEMLALDRAGEEADGATLYLTLEPCVHWGRTPPCIDRLLKSGLARFVISSRDPNPLMNGKGIARLKRAGFPVTTGVLKGRHEKLNEAHIKYIAAGLPFVTIKAAVTLDGKMAAAGGDSRWISCGASRDYAHLLREENDAVMVGIGTVLADDPLLTVRTGGKPGRKTTRIILDSKLRVPATARLLSAPHGGPVLIFAGAAAPSSRVKALTGAGAEVIIDEKNARPGLEFVLRELGRREFSSVLVEGGPGLITAFLDQRLADKAIIFIAPKLVGGESAPSLFGGRGAEKMADCLELERTRSFSLGSDIIVEGYFRCSQV